MVSVSLGYLFIFLFFLIPSGACVRDSNASLSPSAPLPVTAVFGCVTVGLFLVTVVLGVVRVDYLKSD